MGRSAAERDDLPRPVDTGERRMPPVRTARDEPLADVVSLYEAACERSRAITEAHALDDLAARSERGDFTLRWVLVHLLEETARHLGHLDLLREHLDGTTGE